jgi:hypothetical protein
MCDRRGAAVGTPEVEVASAFVLGEEVDLLNSAARAVESDVPCTRAA